MRERNGIYVILSMIIILAKFESYGKGLSARVIHSLDGQRHFIGQGLSLLGKLPHAICPAVIAKCISGEKSKSASFK